MKSGSNFGLILVKKQSSGRRQNGIVGGRRESTKIKKHVSKEMKDNKARRSESKHGGH